MLDIFGNVLWELYEALGKVDVRMEYNRNDLEISAELLQLFEWHILSVLGATEKVHLLHQIHLDHLLAQKIKYNTFLLKGKFQRSEVSWTALVKLSYGEV